MKPSCVPSKRVRNCYCATQATETNPHRELPPGYCGRCERCGKPGHTQHFPGPIPYTGAWCDRCVRIVALTWPLKTPTALFILLSALLLVGFRWLTKN
jgi:hypothetical protein